PVALNDILRGLHLGIEVRLCGSDAEATLNSLCYADYVTLTDFEVSQGLLWQYDANRVSNFADFEFKDHDVDTNVITCLEVSCKGAFSGGLCKRLLPGDLTNGTNRERWSKRSRRKRQIPPTQRLVESAFLQNELAESPVAVYLVA